MRRVVILALMLGLMAAIQTLQVGSSSTLDALSLATFGFVLLAAYTLGQVSASMGLPKITGYILTGLAFGPQILNVFSSAVAADLRVVNDLAIGLIALGAGAEMQLGNLRKIARSLALIIVLKGLLILVAIVAAVWALASQLPFLSGQPTGLVLSVGMILGVLAIGTSPAATIAVISETGAKGRLADTALGVAVGKDIVMVVLLALAIALATTYGGDSHGFEVEILTDLGKELGLSLLAGLLLGGIIVAYLRYVAAEPWLFLVAVVFAMTAVAQHFHLEALLSFIVGGFVVQNGSKLGHDFVDLVETVALPVFVVFFSAAGAGIDLDALRAVGLVAIALVLVRLAAIWVGSGLATRLAGEPEAVQKNAWLAFVAQAGVVIGLTIIIEEKLPALGPEIRTLVMGMVAIHLLLGPILFKIALSRAGEIPGTGEGQPDDEATESQVSGLQSLQIGPLAPDLAAIVDPLEGQVQGLVEELADAGIAGAIGVSQSLSEGPADFSYRFEQASAEWDQGIIAAWNASGEKIRGLCLAVPRQAIVQLDERWYTPHRLDLSGQRWRKRSRRVRRALRRAAGVGPHLSRTVPLRDLVLYHVNHLLAEDLEPVVSSISAQPALTLRALRDGAPPENPTEADDQTPLLDPASAASQFELVVRNRFTALRRDLAIVGTGELPASKRRPSRLHERALRARKRTVEAVSAWKDLATSVLQHAQRGETTEALRHSLAQLFDDFEPKFGERFEADIEAPLSRALAVLDRAQDALGAVREASGDEATAALAQLGEDVSAELRKEALAGLRRSLETRRVAAVFRELERKIDNVVDDLPTHFRVADPSNLPDPTAPPRSYPSPAEYEFQLIAKSVVERTVRPSLGAAGERSLAALADAAAVVHRVREELELGFEAAVDAALDHLRTVVVDETPISSDGTKVAERAIARAHEALDEALVAAGAARNGAQLEFATDVDELVDGLGQRLAGARPLEARLQAERARVELTGPAMIRLLTTRVRTRLKPWLKRFGLARKAARGEDRPTSLIPAGRAGSDRAVLFRILFDNSTAGGRVFDRFLIVTILASILVVMLDSVASMASTFGRLFVVLEWSFTLVFTFEYVARVWSVKNRWRYILSFYGVIDLIALAPTYLGLFVPGGRFLVAVRALRVLRVFRVFKLARYVGEANVLGNALRASRFKITVFIVSVLIVTVVVGSIMFLIEGAAAGFTSIPRGVYWSVVTLTTVGYGDIAPVTPLGQTLAAMLMILGYGVIAVPTGIITAEYSRASDEDPVAARSEEDRICQTCSVPESDPGARFCRACGAELEADT